MDKSLWTIMHGGTTHFPIALVTASVLFDLAGSLVSNRQKTSRCAGLRAAGFYTLILGALGSLGAVVSGLFLSRGHLWGHGYLAHHHTFLWPAFGLLTGLTVWRLVVGHHASSGAFRIYLGATLIAAVLIGATGYWGGELSLNR